MSDLVPSSTVTARMRSEYSACRTELEAAGEEMGKYIRENTQAERRALEAAVEALDRKQRQLSESKAMQAQRRKHRAALDRLEDVTVKIESMQRKALRAIQDLNVSVEEKRELWRQVQDGIETIMHSDDEIKAIRQFKKQFKAMVGGGGGGGGGPPLLLLG